MKDFGKCFVAVAIAILVGGIFLHLAFGGVEKIEGPIPVKLNPVGTYSIGRDAIIDTRTGRVVATRFWGFSTQQTEPKAAGEIWYCYPLDVKNPKEWAGE
jgi:hypothetical protein